MAAFSPTGLSINDEAVKINEGLLGSLYQEGTMRVGDAVLDSQHFYRAQYPAAAPLPWRFMLDIYNLMGDPATVLH